MEIYFILLKLQICHFLVLILFPKQSLAKLSHKIVLAPRGGTTTLAKSRDQREQGLAIYLHIQVLGRNVFQNFTIDQVWILDFEPEQ